ncbi:hypothetical protein CCR75_003631 [Bremia lactucae]|uniref:Probable pectate lyase F n=1 Tax=Bremia lactucae TaxID=4779 RepID=A0A976ILH4_BRELC|nr:hypothetical protein CCR75_003631 [Bremia lactucae]
MLQAFKAIVSLVVASTMVAGLPVPDGTWPKSTGLVSFDEPYVVKSGETYDGKMQTFDRSNIKCEGQKESGAETSVFKLEPGATLRNCIIGKNQMEGVHCFEHDCIVENVWWDDVCEDAFTIKGGKASSVTKILGGGARYADDKVFQHNSVGTVVIDGFFAQDFGKLYRSCGTCSTNPAQRFLKLSNVYADLTIIKAKRVDPNVSIVMMNENYKDEAVLRNITVKPGKEPYTECSWAEGLPKGGVKPRILGNGPKKPVCQYLMEDIHLIKPGQGVEAGKVHPAGDGGNSNESVNKNAISKAKDKDGLSEAKDKDGLSEAKDKDGSSEAKDKDTSK